MEDQKTIKYSDRCNDNDLLWKFEITWSWKLRIKWNRGTRWNMKSVGIIHAALEMMKILESLVQHEIEKSIFHRWTWFRCCRSARNQVGSDRDSFLNEKSSDDFVSLFASFVDTKINGQFNAVLKEEYECFDVEECETFIETNIFTFVVNQQPIT